MASSHEVENVVFFSGLVCVDHNTCGKIIENSM